MAKLLMRVFSFVRAVIGFFLKIPLIGPWIDFITLLLCAGVSRFGAGRCCAKGSEKCPRPKKLLKLYEYEGCPYCRKVRETLNVLDLDAIIYPCPRESWDANGIVKTSKYRNKVKELGGKAQFPFLVDENNINEDDNKPVMLYESAAIIRYLFKHYGTNATPRLPYFLAKKSGNITAFLAQIWRPLNEHGLFKSIVEVTLPKNYKFIEIYQFEPSPFCKRVREVLTCLQIPYIYRSIAQGSPKRKEFKNKFSEYYSKSRQSLGVICVPLIFDPNTNTTMTESRDIVKYLYDTYTANGNKKKEN